MLGQDHHADGRRLAADRAVAARRQGRHRLVDEGVDVTARLDAVSVRAGTRGNRDKAQQEYFDKCERWAEESALCPVAVATPGTDAWRTAAAKHYAQQIEHPSWQQALELRLAAGKSKDEIVADRVRSEEQAMTAGPLWIAT